MIANRGLADSRLHRDAVYDLTCADPLTAARQLARGLRQQTRGAKLAVLRHLAEAVEEHERGMLRELASDLARIAEQGD